MFSNHNRFFIVPGAPKAGSTSLYHYLRQHPEIFLPHLKESRFFTGEMLWNTLGHNRTTVFEPAVFENLYSDANPDQLFGDLGNSYMMFPEYAIKNIQAYLPSADIKIVFVLRDPVQRAYSAYLYACREGIETKTFQQGLALETERFKERYLAPEIISYLGASRYYRPVQLFSEAFPTEVITLEALEAQPVAVFKRLLRFLEVADYSEAIDFSPKNKGGWVPAHPIANQLVFNYQKKLKKLRPYFEIFPMAGRFAAASVKTLQRLRQKTPAQQAPPLGHDDEMYLREHLAEDVQQLRKYLNRSFDEWSI